MSANLESLLAKIAVGQPVLVSMLKKYVLTEKSCFTSTYNGSWKEDTQGQIVNVNNASLFLNENSITLLASASVVGIIANSISSDATYWCSVKIHTVAEGCSDFQDLSLEAKW